MKKTGVMTVIGNIASGKSTAVPILAEAMKGQAVFADELFQTIDPFKDDYLKNPKRWGFTNELWLTIERVNLLKTHRQDAKKKWQVVDSGVLMSWAYTHGHFLAGNLTIEEWGLYERLFRRLTGDLLDDTVVVTLNCPVSILRKRIERRGKLEVERRFEVKYYNRAYLTIINKGLMALKRKLRKERVKLVMVNEAKILNFAKTNRGKKQLMKLVTRAL